MAGVYVCADVLAVERLHRQQLTAECLALPIVERLSRHAQGLLAAHRNGDPAAVVELKNHHPTSIGRPPDEILAAPLDLDGARLTIAREFGYRDWSHVEADGEVVADAAFEAAVDAVVIGDVGTLAPLLDGEIDADARSSFAHRATLLIYLAANGVEIHRQKTPLNAADVAQLLIRAGASVDARARVYGGEFTALQLLATSAHPADAGVAQAVLDVLRAAGAAE